VKRILEILDTIDSDRGGSCNKSLYNNFLRPPLDVLLALNTSTLDKVTAILPDIQSGMTVLDFGCANGAIGLELAHHGAEVWGYDIDPRQLAIAEIAAEIYGLPNYHIFDSWRSFDVIVDLNVWKWIVRWAGRAAADERMMRHRKHCSILFFDAGVSGVGTDVVDGCHEGTAAEVLKAAGWPRIESVKVYVDNINVRREIWKAS